MSSLKIVADALRAEAAALAHLGDHAPIRGILERVAARLEAHDARIEGILDRVRPPDRVCNECRRVAEYMANDPEMHRGDDRRCMAHRRRRPEAD